MIGDESDGFATAMITLALKDAGLPAEDKGMKAARSWLIAHQNRESGGLPATSINKLREPSTDPFLFMTDAATGFATLALAEEPNPGRRTVNVTDKAIFRLEGPAGRAWFLEGRSEHPAKHHRSMVVYDRRA